jgi:energy-coupling factor transport system ATP-binding protein
MTPLIIASQLSFTFQDGTRALRALDLTINKGEFIAVVGQNGSGKSTLAKCLTGILKPTSGSVMVDGFDTRSKRITKHLVTRVGYVFQNPDHQLFNRSVWKEIAYGPRNLGLSHAEIAERVKHAAAVVGIHHSHFDTHPFLLPKGLRQRVAIASVLSMRPQSIIVDEPTTGQDPQQAAVVMDFLRRLRSEEGHTILMVTHEMRLVADYSERTVVLGQGRLLIDAPTRAVFSQPALLRQTFVEPPQITRLAQSLSEEGIAGDVLTLEEAQQEFLRLRRTAE